MHSQGFSIQDEGFLRIKQIVGPNGLVPVGASTWWGWVKEGKAPKPVKFGPMTTAWRVSDIRAFLDKISQEGGVQ
jgi:predicted DNA-binding transcriptional regulator AlpA